MSRLTVVTATLLEAGSGTMMSSPADFGPILPVSMGESVGSRTDLFRCGYQSTKRPISIAPKVGTVQLRLSLPRKSAAHRTEQADAARTKTHITQKRLPLLEPHAQCSLQSKITTITITARMHVPTPRIPTCGGPEWLGAMRTGFDSVKFLTNSLCCPGGGSSPGCGRVGRLVGIEQVF